MRRPARLRIALALSLLCASSPASAQAVDPQNVTAAHALFDQAIAEMEAGRYASACKKLEEVTRLLPRALGARLDLGDCYEKTNRLASAWAQFMTVYDIATRDGEFERAREAGLRAEALRPRLATLSIEVAPEVRKIPGLSITRDGLPLGEAQWGLPLPADAGTHTIVATAPGYEPFTKRIDGLLDGAKAEVRIERLARDPKAAVRPSGGPIVIQAPPDVAWQRPTGMIAAGIGGATLVSGLVAGGFAIMLNQQSNAPGRCDARNECDAEGLALRQTALATGHAATGLVVAGTALLSGGVLLWALSPEIHTKGANALGVRITPRGIGFSGSF
ncbi:hypothetical protein [Polyangium sp. y55x31]|uniref:hypothetical protein n=1 Tax=Polyangium sp. y55x31 TaxID=3042688 RepID=UPI002483142D|nr:hypothetical protein [Polyangium sp. y55x31]MDI1476819.1 hypothetical protein [Polyangium sp. y55x31]